MGLAADGQRTETGQRSMIEEQAAISLSPLPVLKSMKCVDSVSEKILLSF